MDDAEISVSWRAAIVPYNGAQPVYGRLSKIGKGRAVVKMDHNLQPGHQCSLAMRLPKNSADEPTQYVEGHGVVATSVLSSDQFLITLQSLEIKGNGETLLREQFRKYKEIWKKS